MTTPNKDIVAILTRLLADVDDRMEFLGSVFNPKENAAENVKESLDKAVQALNDYWLGLIDSTYRDLPFTKEQRLDDPYMVGAVEIREQLRQELRNAINQNRGTE